MDEKQEFKQSLKITIKLIPIILIIGIIISIPFYFSYNEAEVTITVKRVERTGGYSGKYLIYTEENVVYQVTDNIFRGQFDASDRYNNLDEDQIYTVIVVGIRSNFLSMYKNIVEIKENKK